MFINLQNVHSDGLVNKAELQSCHEPASMPRCISVFLCVNSGLGFVGEEILEPFFHRAVNNIAKMLNCRQIMLKLSQLWIFALDLFRKDDSNLP